MKKIIIPVTVAVMLCAANAFAAAGSCAETKGLWGETPAKAAIAKASKNVRFGWYTDETNGTGYTINTFHLQGTKCYGSGSDSTKLFFKPCTVDDTAGDALAPSSSVGTDAYSSWTQM